MRYIIIDLEATCWQDVRDFDRMETIEIGAVELPSAAAPHDREFNQFIQPVAEPQLSEFCRDLTSIQQQDVNSANHFWGVFQDFLKWIGEAPFVICS